MAELLGPGEVGRAAELLAAGGLVAFPTETVYGLGADASSADAVARIFEAKGRPTGHPLIAHVAAAADVPPLIGQSSLVLLDDVNRLARSFWPGPLTVIVPRSDRVDPATTGGRDTVGIRVPDHSVATALLQAFGGPVAAPSANRFGSVSPTTAAHVMDELGSRIDAVMDGGVSKVGVESTIVDLTTGAEPALLRPGGISQVELESVLGRRVVDGSGGESRAPGMLVSHYAPHASVEVVMGGPDELASRLGEPTDGLVGVVAPWASEHHPTWVVPADAAGYASVLYLTLRAADAAGVKRLLVAPPDDGPLLPAVLDRLHKAAAPRFNPASPPRPSDPPAL